MSNFLNFNSDWSSFCLCVLAVTFCCSAVVAIRVVVMCFSIELSLSHAVLPVFVSDQCCFTSVGYYVYVVLAVPLSMFLRDVAISADRCDLSGVSGDFSIPFCAFLSLFGGYK